jgi:hypothetical protein
MAIFLGRISFLAQCKASEHYQEEYIGFLQALGIPYDPKVIFD